MKTLYTFLLTLLTPLLLSAQVWTTQNPNYPQPLFGFDIEAASATAAWSVGITGDFTVSPWNIGVDGHYVTHTADGGATWTSDTFPSTGAGYTANISAINANVAWIAYVDYNDGNHVFKTVDGGASWTDQNIPINVWVDVVHFWDQTSGFAMGDPDSLGFQIATSNNGGTFWNRVPPATVPPPLPGEFGITNNYCVMGNKVWFATNYGRVYYSSNKGVTWTVSDPGANAFPNKVACDANGHWLEVFGDYTDPLINKYHLWRSVDAGVSWTEITPADNEWDIVAIQYVPNGGNTLIATFRHNNLTGPFETRVSHDHGDSWLTIDNTTKVFDLAFASPTIGWATEYKTTDAVATSIFKYSADPLVGLFSPNALDAEITLSPNPTADQVTVNVQARQAGDFWILLNDAQGKLIRKETVRNETGFEKTWTLQSLPVGEYVITVSSPEGSASRKLLIAH